MQIRVFRLHGGRLPSPGFIDIRHPRAGIKSTAVIFLLMLAVVAITIQWTDYSIVADTNDDQVKFQFPEKSCSIKCPRASPLNHNPSNSSIVKCPEYFKWIHEDLRPWKETGITAEMVERAKDVAHIRVVIVKGKVYVQKYKKVFQTRDIVTVWGVLQLLKLYPGKLPDLDLMFECNDKPVIPKRDYAKSSEGSAPLVPPPVLHYCGDDSSYDIVFPDWSFWGWPELNIRPWEILKKELKESNDKMKWKDREPYAYWRGNAKLGVARPDLVKCNVSAELDWNARIYDLEWQIERKQGFKTTNLTGQCHHRYKIYAEGIAWSVSEKYILACDSMGLVISPHYYDFYSRSLLPTVHYWPINESTKCRSIKFAVDWGNKYPNKAEKIGKAGNKFVQEQLEMKFVYDYMFHLLSEYAKLLKYKPAIPKGSVEVCTETFICAAKGVRKRFRIYSMVKNPADTNPCNMPHSYDFRAFLERKQNLTREVEMLEANEMPQQEKP